MGMVEFDLNDPNTQTEIDELKEKARKFGSEVIEIIYALRPNIALVFVGQEFAHVHNTNNN